MDKILEERVKLFIAKLSCLRMKDNSKVRYIYLNKYNVFDYVRLQYLLGEPL